MRLPPLNGLRAFEAAARHMSFKLAAEELNVTPTAVSHQIRRLEAFLGVRLFNRQNRGLRLTSKAREYLPSVRVAFDELRDASERLHHVDRSTLTVCTLTYVGARWIVQRLGSFKSAHPDIDVRIATSPEPADFSNGEFDLGIRHGDGNWPGLLAERLMTQKIVPVLSPNLLAEAGPITGPGDLAQFTLLHVATEPRLWQEWLDHAGVGEVDTSHGLTFDQSITAIQAAIDGLGIALGRTPFIYNELNAGSLVAPVPLYLSDEADFYIVTRQDKADQPKIDAFRKWLLAEVNATSV